MLLLLFSIVCVCWSEAVDPVLCGVAEGFGWLCAAEAFEERITVPLFADILDFEIENVYNITCVKSN